METLRERIAFNESAGFAFNADERTLENVAICGRKSKNGYEYSEAALKEAASMYDGRPVFLNHTAGANPKDRDIRDVAGRIEGPAVYDGERLRGRIRLLETDAGRTLASLAAAGMDVVTGVQPRVSVLLPPVLKIRESTAASSHG